MRDDERWHVLDALARIGAPPRRPALLLAPPERTFGAAFTARARDDVGALLLDLRGAVEDCEALQVFG